MKVIRASIIFLRFQMDFNSWRRTSRVYHLLRERFLFSIAELFFRMHEVSLDVNSNPNLVLKNEGEANDVC